MKHTGDGIMASFTSVSRAVGCAVAIQKQLADLNSRHNEEALSVRIGLSAGEPVTDGGDLFGAVVQLAARLCALAEPAGILTSTAVRDLSIGEGLSSSTRARYFCEASRNRFAHMRCSGAWRQAGRRWAHPGGAGGPWMDRLAAAIVDA